MVFNSSREVALNSHKFHKEAEGHDAISSQNLQKDLYRISSIYYLVRKKVVNAKANVRRCRGEERDGAPAAIASK